MNVQREHNHRTVTAWRRITLLTLIVPLAIGCGGTGEESSRQDAADRHDQAEDAGATLAEDVRPAQMITHEPLPGETHLRNIRQLTYQGENAEAYFSFDGKALIFQTARGSHPCDQIYTMSIDGAELTRVSTGLGRTTCAYFYPDDDRIVYASTHAGGTACPPVPDHSQGYVWPIYDTYEIYAARADGTELVALTNTPGYDAEATIGPDGTIVFTSMRDGDLDLYTMAADGSNVRRLTDELGYDGGAFFSADGTKIVYRAQHPEDPAAAEDYQRLLAQGLVRPGALDIFVMDADGGNKRQVTRNGAANFCPFFHPSGEKIIFASNLHNPQGRNFDLFMIRVDGTGLEQITFEESFDGFPMFSPDGTRLVFGSNRATPPGSRDTHVFIADWIDSP